MAGGAIPQTMQASHQRIDYSEVTGNPDHKDVHGQQKRGMSLLRIPHFSHLLPPSHYHSLTSLSRRLPTLVPMMRESSGGRPSRQEKEAATQISQLNHHHQPPSSSSSPSISCAVAHIDTVVPFFLPHYLGDQFGRCGPTTGRPSKTRTQSPQNILKNVRRA